MLSPSPAPSARRHPGGRELGLAALMAAILAALMLWDGLVSLGHSAYLAPDTATVAEPWNSLLEGRPGRPRNPGLSDQGVACYPLTLWVLESWERGDPPLWNPLIFAGAPALGNPQVGVLDPQVSGLLPLYSLWGAQGLHIGLFLVAWARLFLACFGTYWLARRLGLGAPGAALAALGFASSGYLVLWLNHPLSHVTPFLPWLLLGVEGCAGTRPGRAALFTGLVAAMSILGGHPETSFYVGAATGVWAVALLRRDRSAGLRALLALAAGALLAAPVWWPFLEYLGASSAQAVRQAAARDHGFDWLALGGILITLGLLGRLYGAPAAPDGGTASDPAGQATADGAGWRQAIGPAALVAGLLVLLVARGLPEGAQLALFPDRFGRPGAGGYRGPGIFLEEASAWLSAPVLGLALAGVFNRRGRLDKRNWVLALGLVAFALALRAPGLLELKQRLPLIGLGATVRLASVSSLMLSLLAGDALECAGRSARRSAALLLGICGVLLLALPFGLGAPPSASEPAEAAEADELVGFLHLPPGRIETPSVPLEGWLAPGLPALRAALRVERLDPPGVPGAPTELGGSFELPLELYQGPRNPADSDRAPLGARFFRTDYLQTNRLSPGVWSFDLALYLEGAKEPSLRRAALARIARPHPRLGVGVLLWLTALCALLLPGSIGRGLALVGAALGGLWFARGQNPAVPLAEVFPLTRTETLLAEHQGSGRFFSDPAVFPPDTGLVRGLRALDGYDGLDPLAYNEFRRLCLEPGVQGLLGWNVRGVRLASGAFRLFGVNHLVLKDPAPLAGFELVAAPDGSAAEIAECFVYRALDPLPNARLVAASVPTPELRRRLEAGEPWEPLTLAAYDGPFVIENPFTQGAVRELSRGNNHVELLVELDGDGLLCLAEMNFPGWSATVDGQPVPVERVNGLFRGLGLHAGSHRVRFSYWPTHLTGALLLCGAGILVLIALGRGPRRPIAR